MELELVAITQEGKLAKPVAFASPLAAQIIEATTHLYRAVGYEPPWVGYLAFENGTCVGSCGFKSPPRNNRVEIAYFTFPEHERRGIAIRMASELIRLALGQNAWRDSGCANVARRKCLNFHFEEAAVSLNRYRRTPRGWDGLGVAAQ
jgi:hypothetical protein